MMTIIGFFLLVSGALWGVWWRIEGKVKEAKTDVSDAAARGIFMATMARDELSAYKLHVAESYVSKSGLRESIEPIMDAIQGVRGAVEHLGGRMDSLYQPGTSASPRPRAKQ